MAVDTAVRMPVLLTNNLTTVRPLKAVGLSLNVSLRERSQGKLTVSYDESPLPMHSFVDAYTHKGKQATYRVTNTALSNERGRVYTLTHAIDTLRDSVYQMQGTFEGMKIEFLETLFSFQKETRWRLGYVEDAYGSYKSPNINYTKLSDLFSRYLQDNPDVYPSYDFSKTPWTVHILKLPTEVSARFSLTRNADTCNVVYDDKNMCNRLYLSVNTPEQVNGITKYNAELRVFENAASIAQYGIIEKTASVKTDEITGGDADAWANAFLEKYAQPEVNITVDGYELYKQTGEIYDEASVGKRATVSMPEYGTTTTQRIESIQYPDVLNAPTAIVVSLATKQKTFTTAISNLEQEVEKVGGVAGGAALSAADAKEVTDWILVRQKIDEAVEETGIVTLWESGIIVDAETGNKIYSLEQGFVSAFTQISNNSREVAIVAKEGQNNASAITANAKSITALSQTVDENGERLSGAEARLDGVEASILLKADKKTVDDLSSTVSQALIDIDGLNAEITLKVNKNGVISEINQTSETVKISASRIALEGLVTASQLQTAIADVNYQNSQAIDTLLISANNTDFNFLNASSLTLGSTLMSKKAITMGLISTGQVLAVSTATLDLSHSHEVSVSDDGTVTLGAASVTGGNFKIADTKIYKDGVSAAKNSVTLSSAGWINGVNTVTASNGKTYPVNLPAFSTWVNPDFDENHQTRAYFYTASVTGTLASALIDASSVYEEGYEDGAASGGNVTLSSAGWINGINTVTASNGASYDVELPDFSTSTTSFSAQHKATVYFSTQSVNQPLKSVEVDASSVYDSGYEDGYMDGWEAAAAVFNMAWSGSGIYDDTLTITHAGATFGSQSVKETLKVTVSCDISNISNPTQGVLYASASARAYTNVNNAGAIQRAYANDTTQINGSLG